MTKTMTGAEILDLPMDPDYNDAEASTIREYLKALLRTLWHTGEGFSGKRPFGNSGWEYDLFRELALAGVLEGTFEEYDLLDYDEDTAHALIDKAIEAL